MSFFNRLLAKQGSRKVQGATPSKLSANSSKNTPIISRKASKIDYNTSDFELEVVEEAREILKPVSINKKSGSDVMEETMAQFLQNHVLFKDLEPSFINILVDSMQVRIFNNMEFVIKKGQVGRAMFFIKRGTMDVISEDGIKISCERRMKF